MLLFHPIPEENGIEEQFVRSEPSTPEVRAVKEVNDSASSGRGNDHTGALFELF